MFSHDKTALLASAVNEMSSFKGDYPIRERDRLEIRMMRKGKQIIAEDVLNDAGINKAALSRLTSCEEYLDR